MEGDKLQLTSEERIIQLEEAITQLSVLYSIAASITTTTDDEKALNLVLEKSLDIFKAEIGAIFLLNDNELRLKVSMGSEFPSSISLEEETIITQVFRLGKAVCANQSNFHPSINKYPLKSIICFPIKIHNKVAGVIYIGRFSEKGFTEEERWLLTVLANRASVAIESSRLYNSLETTNKKLDGKVELANQELLSTMSELKGLYEVAQTMVASMEIDEILGIIIKKANELAKTNISTLRLLNEKTGELEIKASVGLKEEIIPLINLKMGEGIVGEVAKNGRFQIVEDLSREKRFDYFPRELQKISSIIVVPIKIGMRVIGVLACASDEPKSFTAGVVDLLSSLSNLSAVAIENARLYQSVIQEREKIRVYASALEKREEELQEANQIKSAFLAIVSHELRTPLTVIRGYLYLLRNQNLGMLNQKQGEGLERIETKAEELEAIINDILDVSRSESGKEIELNFELTNITMIIDEIIFGINLAADKKGIKVENKIPKNFPMVRCDANRMRQVFSNLLDNALKFTKKGEIIVEAISTKDEFEFTVADTGIGIQPEYLEKIFERFFQVDSSATRPYGGIGLGLAIIKEIISLHKGTIKVESKQGEGSKFIIRLPKREK